MNNFYKILKNLINLFLNFFYCLLKLIMDNCIDRNNIYKQIKIPSIIPKVTNNKLMLNYQNTQIQNNKYEKKSSLSNRTYLHTLLKSSSTSDIRNSIKFSPNRIIMKDYKNSPNKIIPSQKSYKNDEIDNDNDINLNYRNENKFQLNEDEKIKTLNMNLTNKNNKKNYLKSRNNNFQKTFLSKQTNNNLLETVKENVENEENERISTTTTTSTMTIFEGKKSTMLQQYFNLSKKEKQSLLNSSKNFNKKQNNFPISFTLNNNNENNRTMNRKMNNSLDRNNSLIINENNNLNKSTDINNHYSCEQLVNIEDLIIIEEKYETIEKLIIEKNYYVLSKTCYEWFNFYFNCRLGGNLTQFFIDNKIKKTIEDSNILSLISLLIIYEFSFHQKLFELHRKLITKISSLINKNYLLICNNFLSKIKKEFLNSIWVERLRNITLNRVNNKEYYINQIDKNTDEIYETITLIISSIKNNNKTFNKKIIEIFNNYSKFSHDKIYRIFLTNILKLNNSSGSILYSNLKSSSPRINFKLKSSPIKPLTLFLDLDETLMSFVFSKENEGISRIRPYLFQFLNLVKNYYELIIFTAARSDYADPILDVIEGKKGTYFSYRLYRESCSIINNYYVKDIGKFGIDLRKSIIVDNMPQNFRLQKENGILISSFWGEDINDKALLYLGRILVTIGMEMVEKNYMIDIRDELVKYRDEILRKVSMK